LIFRLTRALKSASRAIMFQSGAPDKGFVGVGVEFDINFIYTRAWVICRDVNPSVVSSALARLKAGCS
jgi:hypothetical protein